jgi:transposase
MRPPISSDEAHRIAFGFSPLDHPYFATRLRDGLGERGQTPRRSRTERQQRARQAADQVGLGTCRGERKARILLKADVADGGEGWSDSRIIKALDTSVSMVYRVRKQLAEEGFEAVLSRKQRATPAVARIFDGEKEAKLVALACSKPPKGRVRWTLRLLENNSASSIAPATQRSGARLKNILQPHRRQCWVIPPKANGAFVAAMEDVLAVYTRPHDPDHPLVCLDETSKQLTAETRMPILMKVGRPARFDYEYERKGTANLFMMFAPLEGWRHVEVTERFGRRSLCQRQDHRAGPGQSQRPQQGFTLSSLSGTRSKAPGRTLRMALHSKTWELA